MRVPRPLHRSARRRAVSPDLISRVTEAVREDVTAWQSRPLDPVYCIVYLDALVVKVRDQGVVRNKSVYIALGVTTQGTKEVLSLWTEHNEGAKFWLKVINELKTRGVNDVLTACCDGLKGFPEAIEAVFPKTVVQTCIVHMIPSALATNLSGLRVFSTGRQARRRGRSLETIRPLRRLPSALLRAAFYSDDGEDLTPARRALRGLGEPSVAASSTTSSAGSSLERAPDGHPAGGAGRALKGSTDGRAYTPATVSASLEPGESPRRTRVPAGLRLGQGLCSSCRSRTRPPRT